MLGHECSTTFGGGGRGMTCSPDDHVMTPWSPPGDYLLFPLFGYLLFWMSPPPPPVLVFYCSLPCIPTSLLIGYSILCNPVLPCDTYIIPVTEVNHQHLYTRILKAHFLLYIK